MCNPRPAIFGINRTIHVPSLHRRCVRKRSALELQLVTIPLKCVIASRTLGRSHDSCHWRTVLFRQVALSYVAMAPDASRVYPSMAEDFGLTFQCSSILRSRRSALFAGLSEAATVLAHKFYFKAAGGWLFNATGFLMMLERTRRHTQKKMEVSQNGI